MTRANRNVLAAVVVAFIFSLVVTLLAALPASADITAAADWSANGDSSVVNPTTVHLEGANTSVETGNLNVNVDAGDEISFRYSLHDGAACTGGAPRVFVVVDGAAPPNNNSWDGNADQCGGADDVVTFAVDRPGLITHTGIVYDNNAGGYVLVSDLRVDGERVQFEEPVDHCANLPDKDDVAKGRVEERAHIVEHVACRHAAQADGTVQLLNGSGPTFTDVDEDHPNYVHVEYLAAVGVAEGYTGPGGLFGPEDIVRRDQFVAFVSRAVEDAADKGATGLDSAGAELGSEIFYDVSASSTHDEVIGVFEHYQLVEGYPADSRGRPFKPGGPVIHNHVDLVVDVRWPAEQTPAS